jgi:hypothetical protein
VGVEDRIEVRVNNIPLGQASLDGGWLVFAARPEQFAVGDNLIGVLIKEREPSDREMVVEKLDLRVRYRKS